MIQILLHSSKTMRIPADVSRPLATPQLIEHAKELAATYGPLSSGVISKIMAVSPKKADEVLGMYAQWTAEPKRQIPAIDAFIGDIYSGLQVQSWSDDDREYAYRHLLILSGLYGGVRACDGIMPYRLEMAYKLPGGGSLYDYWGSKIADLIPEQTSHILNLSAVEYTKAVLPYVGMPVVTPKFLTVSPKTNEPVFVTVHAKIARGAFAGWMVKNRIDDIAELKSFSLLNYSYDRSLSTPEQPVFVCKEFGGLGLSVRLTK